MYIDIVPNRTSRPAILLRESRRQGKRTIKTTLANMTDWPEQLVTTIRLALQGEPLVPKSELIQIERSLPHGHVHAVLSTIRSLGLENILASKKCRSRDLVVAMIVQCLVDPCSKLETARSWHDTSLATELGVSDASEDDLYDALDWLYDRQERIENKLAKKHLSEGAVVLYDLTSSSYTGRTCLLAFFGKNRDRTGDRCIAYGLLADRHGRPIAVTVYQGNTGDPTTVPDQVHTLGTRFGLQRIVLVGDRGMLTQAQITTLRDHSGIGWISALRSDAIRGLVNSGSLQLSLFDQQNLMEIISPDFPEERLIACFNPLLAEDRRRTREDLLAATEHRLEKIAAEVGRRTKTPLKADEIGIKVGRVLSTYRMAKHFAISITDGQISWERKHHSIEQEARLDGVYVIRTSEARTEFSAEDTVRIYKSLSNVEQAFRCLKAVDLRVRPIRHRTIAHVCAHIFLCTLAYYVEWHMRKALAPLLFADEDLERSRISRDPVAKARPSSQVNRKKSTHHTPDGWPVHSLHSLMTTMGTRCINTCRVSSGTSFASFEQVTEPTPLQEEVYRLLGVKP